MTLVRNTGQSPASQSPLQTCRGWHRLYERCWICKATRGLEPNGFWLAIFTTYQKCELFEPKRSTRQKKVSTDSFWINQPKKTRHLGNFFSLHLPTNSWGSWLVSTGLDSIMGRPACSKAFPDAPSFTWWNFWQLQVRCCTCSRGRMMLDADQELAFRRFSLVNCK